ncbi:MAG: LysM peptidoglycan-binding domain-containing protein [Bacteriovoracaceae bacterium]|nr:LysM peptidoglycan-binding domain-containing protein [Bacteriovoracaceae bacterium]
MRNLVGLVCLWSLFGCSTILNPVKVPDQNISISMNHLEESREATHEAVQESDIVIDPNLIQQVVEKKSSVRKTIQVKKPSAKMTDITSDVKDGLKLDYDSRLYDFWIRHFSKKAAKGFQRHLNNAAKYEGVVRKILKKNGVPEDIFYLGIIESGYSSRAKSSASAVGYWQFMRGTAKAYGLRVDRSVDERRSIYKSTNAAAMYLKDLYNIFGNWELALLAYNKGEYGVIRAIRKGNSRNYRKLVKMKLLPRETVYYIPKIVAARDIAQNPVKYGLKKSGRKGSINSSYRAVKLRSGFDIRKVAKEVGVSVGSLSRLNRDIKRRHVKVVSRRPYDLYLPKISDKRIKRLAKNYFSKGSTARKRKPAEGRKKYRPFYYRVRGGDTLSGIAVRFGCTVSRLKKMNKLRSARILSGKKLRIPGSGYILYTVRKGDYLGKVARKYGLSVNRIVVYNSLRSKRIYPKQKLKIPANI